MSVSMQPFRGDGQEWDRLIQRLPAPHLLQSWEWASVKEQYGWEKRPMLWMEGNTPRAAAMLLRKPLRWGGFAARLSLVYLPKGPLLDWEDVSLRQQVLDDLQRLAHRFGALFLKIDPDVILGYGVPGREEAREEATGWAIAGELERRGWRFSPEQVQFRNTVWVDLRLEEAQLLAQMKQKTRYNIRLAERKGVYVRLATPADWPLLYEMYAETAQRDGFIIREREYYYRVWERFSRPEGEAAPRAEALIAEVEGEAVAGLFLFSFAGRAYYLYGMSRALHREKMPTYLLQWEAMRRARAQGCTMYDLWGAPDEFQEGDRLWGVFRFKEGLGGQVVRTLGAWDYTIWPFGYRLFTSWLPRWRAWQRRRYSYGASETRKEVREGV
jgi:peptidoglycan pentaglycine glycine transferase (the first glycine)